MPRTAVAAQHGNPLGKLVSLGSPKNYTCFVGMESGLLSDCVILLHDNACLHMAHQTWALLQKFGWDMLDHPPIYSRFGTQQFSSISHLEGALARTFFYPHWRYQLSLHHVADAVRMYVVCIWDGHLSLSLRAHAHMHACARARARARAHTHTHTHTHTHISTIKGTMLKELCTSCYFIAYCQLSPLKSCLWITVTVNLFSDPF
jgi:hypothetical protein